MNKVIVCGKRGPAFRVLTKAYVDSILEPDMVIIKDVGPWNKHRSVTNGAEEVVETLKHMGFLQKNQRILYYDSAGCLDELLVKDGVFAGFKPGPKKENLKNRKEELKRKRLSDRRKMLENNF